MARQNEIKFLTSTRVEKRQKKYCRFKKMGIRYIDYKDAEFLKKFLNDQGKMLPRRITGNSLKFQSKVAQAIKKARQMSLLPYVTDLLSKIDMQVILIKDVDNLGAAHELVTVKPGYARNYLIPQKYAIEASGSNMKILEERRKQKDKREQILLAEIAKVKQVLTEGPVKVGAKVGVSGKIFGSVTAIQIARAIREQKGYDIDRRRISITSEEVKEAGTFNAQIDFGKENIVDLQFEVVGE